MPIDPREIQLPTICQVRDRRGSFRIIRKGRINSRVQEILEEQQDRPKTELVPTESIFGVRNVAQLPRQGITEFRNWFTEMTDGWGARPEWPQLLSNLLHQQYMREREVDRQYTGDQLLSSRVHNPPPNAVLDEKQSVANLYWHCREYSDGCLSIGDDIFWLLGYEVPNQHFYQGQRADLIGMDLEGGLVVFEAKLTKNTYAPVCALLEGLDYLAGLTCSTNFAKLQREIAALGSPPNRFREVGVNRDARHSVVVLAEQDYFYSTHERSSRGKGWRELARLRYEEDDSSIGLRFAMSDFKQSQGEWIYGE